LLIGMGITAVWLTTSRASQVTLREAESRPGSGGNGTSTAGRPVPGVYAYSGTGTEHLSLPPLSQAEGPTIPGTVTLDGPRCWVFRIDYSTHHWQTWHYCQHGTDLWEAGGQSWQLWPVGPFDVTNVTSFTCEAGSMALPGRGSVGQIWASRCSGTNTSVKGVTVSAGPYRLIGTTVLSVGGVPVRVVHFRRTRTDSGAQVGTERADVWIDPRTGLPVRLEQHLRVTTSTMFGTSTYTQDGVLMLASLVPHREKS
jgi:hypothetical protein